MTQPDDLKTDERLVWSTGRGTEVWALFCACAAGDLSAVRKLLDRDPSLVKCQHEYRKPLYFAVRENRLEVAAYLLERDLLRVHGVRTYQAAPMLKTQYLSLLGGSQNNSVGVDGYLRR